MQKQSEVHFHALLTGEGTELELVRGTSGLEMLKMMGELALTSVERSMGSTVVIKDFVASYLAGPNLSSVVGALSSQQ